MQQLGNIIKPQKLTPPDAPTVEVAFNNSVSNRFE